MAQHDQVRVFCQDALWRQILSAVADHLKALVEGFMEHRRDSFCGCAAYERSQERRALRNGFYQRRLDTTLGSLVLGVPRVRQGQERFDTLILDAYRRRGAQVDRAVLRWVACGQSAREVSATLEGVFGGVLSPGGVSAVVAKLDSEIGAFHTRPLTHIYRFLYLDAKHWHTSHLRKRPGRGKKRKAVLLIAWGVRHDATEELVDFRVADSESEAAWTDFLTDLEARGLRRRNPWGQELQMIVTDGDVGLRSALLTVYPTVPKQRCIFHKVQDIAEHLRERAHRAAILASAAAIYDGLRTPYQALYRLKRWADYWRDREPQAVRAFAYEFEDTLLYLNAPPPWHRRLKTTNPVERFIRELNKKTNKVGVYPSAASWERATYLTWRKLQAARYAPTARANARAPFPQNS